jgi:hypothetical protein
MSITELIAVGNLSAEMAAVTWLCLENGASIVVASDPPSSGKTTTLSALLPFFPRDALLYFTKGLGERFELPALGDVPVYLMVNEISDHLPVYSWGSHVQRIFELLGEGYALASTMHCDSTEEVVEQLVEDIGVPPGLVGHLTLVLPIAVEWTGSTTRRRVLEVALLEPGKEGPSKTSLVRWQRSKDLFEPPSTQGLAALACYLGLSTRSLTDDLSRRTDILTDLTARRAGSAEIESAVATLVTDG